MTCAVSLLASQMALADIKVRAGVASGSYSVDLKNASGVVYQTVNAKYTPINLGASYVANNGFYVDFGYTGGSGTHDMTSTDKTFRRSDLALIAGKSNVRESGFSTSFYGGFKTGQTVLTSSVEDKLVASGLVGGVGVGFPVGPGSLGVNVGLGIMKANWDKTGSAIAANNRSYAADTAVGFSFGLGYTYPINETMGVVVDYKGHGYSYVFDSGLSTEFTVTETTNAVGANFYATF